MKETYFSETFNSNEIRKTLEEWKGQYPGMGVLALVPEADSKNIQDLQKIFSELNIPLTGAIFPALVANSQFYNNAIWLIPFETMPYHTLISPLSDDTELLKEQIDLISREMNSHIDTGVETTLFMIFDAMVPNIATILDKLYLMLADRVHYMGVNAGSETFQPIPCLFDHQQIVQNGILLMLLKNHHGAILEHGYLAPPQLTSATSTRGNRIISIDWRPAFEVYREVAKNHFGVSIDKDNFYQYGVHFPFGILRANGEILVRIPVALEKDGSLFCVGEVPPNSILTLLNAPEVDLPQTVKTLTQGLIAQEGSTKDRDILTFYCAGRRLHLGETSIKELSGLKQESQARQIIGALSLGEIGSSTRGGYPLFHNATLVCSFRSA